MSKYSVIAEYIRSARSVALVCHINPDGDTLGSANALRLALRDKAQILCDDSIPAKYVHLNIQRYNIGSGTDCDLYIFVDCSSRHVAGSVFDRIPDTVKRVVIDHHKTNELQCDASLIDSNRSSTAEIVFDLLEHMNLAITREMAESLYTALITDNGMFSYGYTTPEAHITASKLLALGVDFQRIANRHFKMRTLQQTMLIKEMLSHIKVYEDVAVSYLAAEDMARYHADISETESLVNYLIEIDVINIAVFLRQIGADEYKVSFRSKTTYDVSALASLFGGGGHAQASGCMVRGSSIDDVTKLILEEINNIKAP